MRALALVPLLVVLLASCSGTAASSGPGIAPRTAIVPEERSTCEALGRADLAVVAEDTTGLDRSAAALDDAARRAPGDVRPALVELAHAYRTSATAAWEAPHRSVVVAWANSRCGGVR